MEYTINLMWDNDASVWIATSDDIKGLILESGSINALIERVKLAIPDLIELNNPISLCFRSERHEQVQANG